MKVGALIQRLSSFDPDLPVIMPGEDADWCEIGGAYEDVAVLTPDEAQIAHDNEQGAQRVVRLFPPELEP